MKFANPAILWSLLLLAIPIIIHLFNFRRYKTLYFSSLKFIKHVDQNANSTRNIKQIIVLILRCLVFTCIIIAFAQPFIPSTNKAEESLESIYAIYIDNSNSMTLRGSEGELLSEARESAISIINKAPADARFLITTNALSGMEGHLLSKVDALQRIDEIKASSLSKPLDQILNWQKEIIENSSDLNGANSQRKYLLLSDFQKVSAKLDKFVADSMGTYYPIKLKAEQEENLYIDSVYFSSPLHQIDQSSELNVRVKNISDENKVNQELNFKCGTVDRDLYIDIPANQSVTTSIKFTEKDLGIIKGQVSVNDKQVTFDDKYYFSYEVRKNLNVLIIDFEDAVSNVATVYNLDPFYKLTNVSSDAFTRENLNNQDLVLLNGCNEVSSGLQDIFTEYVDNNGSLAIFPGKSLNLSQVNTWLRKLQMPQLGKLSSSGIGIKNVNYQDVFFKGVFENKPSNLNMPSIKAAYSQLSTGSAISLINFQNSSALFYKASGNARVYLFTSSLSGDFGTFTSNALFPTILLRMAELSQRAYPESIEIGQESRFPVYGVLGTDEVLKISSDKMEFIPQILNAGTKTYISFNSNQNAFNLDAGFYAIKKGNETFGTLAMNYNRVESEIQTAELDAVKSELENKGAMNVSANTIDAGNATFEINLNKDKERWRLFLILAIVFLLVEMIYLKFVLK